MSGLSCKLLIIGGGPGGYVCAIRAGQLGIDTVLVEREHVGGTCLNIGCIPSKALIHAADEFARISHLAKGSAIGIGVSPPTLDLARTMAWKDSIVSRLNGGVFSLLRKAKVRVLQGVATLQDGKSCRVDTDSGSQLVKAEHVVVATGSEPSALPSLPFGGIVVSSTGALALREVPKKLVVIGGGYIGLELGFAYRKLGSEVAIVEAAENLLPQYDSELVRPVAVQAEALGIKLHLGTRAVGLSAAEDGLRVVDTLAAKTLLPADKVLLAIGRKARIKGYGLEALDLKMSGQVIAIDERCRTSMRNVWAIGDVTGEPMLAHRAMAQGEMVAELIAGHKASWDKVAMPAVCFTDPEIVVVGQSPDAARAAGIEVKVGTFPFLANGRSMTMESETGFVRIVARADTHVILGIQAVGRGVAELAAGFGLALEMGARLEDIAGTVHAHPTQGEALQEAALRALGRALHV